MGGVCEFRFSRFKLWKATLTNRFYGKLLVTHLNLRRWKTFLSKISKFVNLSNTTKWFWPWSVNSNDFKRNNTSRDQIDRAVNPDFRLIRSRINRCKYIDLDRRVYLHYRRWHYRRDSTDLGQCRRWTLLTVTLPMGTLPGHNTGQFTVRLPDCKFANSGGAQMHKKIESGYRTERTVFSWIWAHHHVREKRLHKGRLTYHATEM